MRTEASVLLYLLLLVRAIAHSVTSAQTSGTCRSAPHRGEDGEDAAGLRSRLQAGEAFEDLANKYSTASSARDGGWLGIFTLSNLRKEFQDALERLVAGEVSPVLKAMRNTSCLSWYDTRFWGMACHAKLPYRRRTRNI
jgi:hypothetical protein